jgi:hypothetical protein
MRNSERHFGATIRYHLFLGATLRTRNTLASLSRVEHVRNPALTQPQVVVY